MDYSAIGAEARLRGPYGTYRFKDYAGEGFTRCLNPRPLKAARVRSFKRWECFTGKQVRHTVTGDLMDVSFIHHEAHDDFIHSQVRCRICPNCIALNSWVWAKAACHMHDEVMDGGGSSAAITLTFDERTFRRWWEEDRDARAREFEAEDCSDAALAAREQRPPGKYFPNNRDHIRIAIAGIGRELTLYNKRLLIHSRRKPGILPVIKAWMGALEFGTKRGRPHLHVLYHLEGDEKKCRLFRRHASRDWSTRVGFTKVKRVCTYRGCSYASKYIGKAYDAGYHAFFKSLSDRPKTSFGTPVMTEADSVEYARLLAVLKLQRTRTRSSLGYRSKGITVPPVNLDDFAPPKSMNIDAPTLFCRECGSLSCEANEGKEDGCGECRSIRPCTDDNDELLWVPTSVYSPILLEDECYGSEHFAEGEMPYPPD